MFVFQSSEAVSLLLGENWLLQLLGAEQATDHQQRSLLGNEVCSPLIFSLEYVTARILLAVTYPWADSIREYGPNSDSHPAAPETLRCGKGSLHLCNTVTQHMRNRSIRWQHGYKFCRWLPFPQFEAQRAFACDFRWQIKFPLWLHYVGISYPEHS